MAVEASHITLLPNREMICQGDAIRYDLHGNTSEKIPPVYGYGVMDMFPVPDFMAESGLTSRKRSRDSSSFNPPFALPKPPIHDPIQRFEFLGEDISSQIYRQQLEIDRFVDRHTEKVRTEIEEMRRRNSRRFAEAYEAIMNRLKTKEDQILKIERLNRSLEQKAESISVENQIWRELAQTNEATANALRNNLQQVLAEIHLQQQQIGADNDVESHCGSNFEKDHYHDHDHDQDQDRRREVAEGGGGGERKVGRWCRKCGKEESCVLLLPCRHLCVCSLCVSSVNVCPVCKSIKSAGVQVNMN